MSWQDRIEKYNASQEQIRQAAVREEEQKKEVARQANETRFNKYTPPLFDALRQVGAEDVLTSIQNDLWKEGEIVRNTWEHYPALGDDEKWSRIRYHESHPRDGEEFPEYVAALFLKAEWPRFHPYQPADGDGETWGTADVPAHIGPTKREIVIGALYDKSGKIYCLAGGSYPTSRILESSDPEIKNKIENVLIEALARMSGGTPSPKRKIEDTKEILRQIEGGYKPSEEERDYLHKNGIVIPGKSFFGFKFRK